VSIGKAIATKNQYMLDAGGEMVALGMINFIGSAFSCCPVTGSFSRSAVNDSTGAQTQIAGIVTSIVMFLVLMCLTPLFYHLPKFALAAIVINSVKNLIAYQEAQHLWKVKRSDCMLWFCSFIGTLFLGIQLGIGIAIGLSLLVILHDTVRPQIVILWRLPHTHVYSSIKTTCQGVFAPGVLVLKVLGSVYFANSRYLQDKIHEIINAVEAKKADKIKFVIISLGACTAVDTSGVHAFHEIEKSLKKEKRHLCFAQVGNRVWRTFVLSGFAESLGEEWVHESCFDATQHCLAYDSSHLTWEHHLTSVETIQKDERYNWRRHDTNLASRSDSNVIQLTNLTDTTKCHE
jgi:sulfate transporter 4